MSALAAIVRRDIALSWRIGGGAAIGVLFFLSVVVLMPFAVGPDLALLKRLGPAILWLGIVYLGSLLALLLQSFFSIDEFSGLINHEFTLKTYAELFRPQNLDIIIRTVTMATLVSVMSCSLSSVEAVCVRPGCPWR